MDFTNHLVDYLLPGLVYAEKILDWNDRNYQDAFPCIDELNFGPLLQVILLSDARWNRNGALFCDSITQ